MKKINKIGVVGNGSMGKRRVYHSLLFGIENVICWDIREDRRNEVKNKFDITIVQSQEEFEVLELDALFISVPPAEHLYYIELAIKNGWNFMVENPVYHKYEPLENIINKLSKTNLVANVSCNVRFLKSIKKIKESIKNNLIGNVIGGVIEIGEFLPDWHPYEPYTDYYPSKIDMGGGLDAICDLDWIVDIFGEIKQIKAIGNTKSKLNIDTYDIIDYIVDFKNGPQIVLHSDMIQSPYAKSIKFFSELGTIKWEIHENKLWYYTRANKEWREIKFEEVDLSFNNNITFTWAENMYKDDSFHFFKCLTNDAKPLNTICSNSKLLKKILNSINYDLK